MSLFSWLAAITRGARSRSGVSQAEGAAARGGETTLREGKERKGTTGRYVLLSAVFFRASNAENIKMRPQGPYESYAARLIRVGLGRSAE
jgi:hypothetical protein